MASSAAPSAAPKQPPSASDTVLRNALRYTVSAREYAALHKYILSKSGALRKRAPSVETVDRVINGDRPPTSSRKTNTKVTKGKGKGVDKGPVEKMSKARNEEQAGSIVGTDDYNARAIRHSIRVFVATSVAMKLWTAVMRRLVGHKE